MIESGFIFALSAIEKMLSEKDDKGRIYVIASVNKSVSLSRHGRQVAGVVAFQSE